MGALDFQHPLVLVALALAAVSVAGLVFDLRALKSAETRLLAASAVAIKLLLLGAFIYQYVQLRLVPGDRYDEFGDYLTFLALVAVSIPMVGIAVVSEIVADRQLTREPPHAHRVEHSDGEQVTE